MVNIKLIWGIFGSIAGLLIVVFVLTRIWFESVTWISDALGLAGCLVSLCGVVMALIQIKQADVQIQQANEKLVKVAEVTDKIEKAVDENREEIRKFLSFADTAHLIGTISNTQTYLRKQDFSCALILMQMIKDDLIRTNSQIEYLIKDEDIDLPGSIKVLNIDIQSLNRHCSLTEGSGEGLGNLRPNEIHKHLELTKDNVIKIETLLKNDKV